MEGDPVSAGGAFGFDFELFVGEACGVESFADDFV